MNGRRVNKAVRLLILPLLHVRALVYQKSNYLTIFLWYQRQIDFVNLLLLIHIGVAEAYKFVSILQVSAPLASCNE